MSTSKIVRALTEDELYRDTIPCSTFVVACLLALTGNVLATGIFTGIAAAWFAATALAKMTRNHQENRARARRVADLHTSIALELQHRQWARRSNKTVKLPAVAR